MASCLQDLYAETSKIRRLLLLRRRVSVFDVINEDLLKNKVEQNMKYGTIFNKINNYHDHLSRDSMHLMALAEETLYMDVTVTMERINVRQKIIKIMRMVTYSELMKWPWRKRLEGPTKCHQQLLYRLRGKRRKNIETTVAASTFFRISDQNNFNLDQ